MSERMKAVSPKTPREGNLREEIASIRLALAEAERERDKLRHFIRRLEEARGKLPDWEKLWEEQSNRADTAEALLAECEAVLGEYCDDPESNDVNIRILLAKLKART